MKANLIHEHLKGSYDILCIGGSAGSLEMLLQIVPHLKKELQIATVIVVHRKSSEDSVLIEILTKKTDLIVKEVEDKEEILPNVIYVAPGDYHLLIEKDGSFSLDDSERVNYSRPSIDVTFESAAEACGKAVIGVLLSGANEDGVAGLQAIKRKKGFVAVQNPASAIVPTMPQLAVNKVEVDMLFDLDTVEKLIKKLGVAI